MPVYSIDTSALIEWWVEKYSPDVFAGIPEKMAGLIAEERLFALIHPNFVGPSYY